MLARPPGRACGRGSRRLGHARPEDAQAADGLGRGLARHQGRHVGLASPARGGGGTPWSDRHALEESVHASRASDLARPRAAPRRAGHPLHPPGLRPAGTLAPAPFPARSPGRARGLRDLLEVAMVLKVFRWGPGTRERLQKYWVRARQGMTVLDALVEVQRGT